MDSDEAKRTAMEEGEGVPLTRHLAGIYTTLWTLSDEADPPVYPRYREKGKMRSSGERGLFALWDGDRPFPHIRVARETCPDSVDDDPKGADLRELISLAHERGHEASWRADTYEVTTMAEERRAWSHAEMILRVLAFQNWPEFQAAKRFSLDEHQKRGTPEVTLARPPRCNGNDHVYTCGNPRCDCGQKNALD